MDPQPCRNRWPKDRVALLVWGDPSLYDSTFRITARLASSPQITVIPGITSLQGLTAAHAIPLNDLAAPFTVTTGRQLRDHGWPQGSNRIAVMLDGDCAFAGLAAPGITIWRAAYVGMPQQTILARPLAGTAERIVKKSTSVCAHSIAGSWISISLPAPPPPRTPPPQARCSDLITHPIQTLIYGKCPTGQI